MKLSVPAGAGIGAWLVVGGDNQQKRGDNIGENVRDGRRSATDSEVLARSGSRRNMPFLRTSEFRFLDPTKQENGL